MTRHPGPAPGDPQQGFLDEVFSLGQIPGHELGDAQQRTGVRTADLEAHHPDVALPRHSGLRSLALSAVRVGLPSNYHG
jgi:hypothetical protein